MTKPSMLATCLAVGLWGLPLLATETGRPAPAVDVTVSLSTSLPAGALFVEWFDGNAARDLGATAFVGRTAANPVTLSVAAPAGSGEFRIHVIGKNARRYSYAPFRADLKPGTRPTLTVVDAESKPLVVSLGD